MWRYRVERTSEQLKDDLRKARHVILEMLLDDTRRLLSGFYNCTDRPGANAWLSQAIDELISRTARIPSEETALSSDRAWCPLCSAGSSHAYLQGFSMPDGLRRHLTGGYNAQQCMVMEQLQAYMEEHWHSQFHLQEEAEYRAEQERIVKRRKAEVLYQVSADGEPQLLDEGIFSDPRSPAQLDWAENRLRTLGFERQQDGNVVSFISEDPDRIVYADPRRTGSIEFRVYKKPLPKRRTTRVRQQASFNVPDTWRNDLPGKYAARLHTAVRGWN